MPDVNDYAWMALHPDWYTDTQPITRYVQTRPFRRASLAARLTRFLRIPARSLA